MRLSNASAEKQHTVVVEKGALNRARAPFVIRLFTFAAVQEKTLANLRRFWQRRIRSLFAPRVILRASTFGADAVGILGIPFDVGVRPATVNLSCFIDERGVHHDLEVNPRTHHLARTMNLVDDYAFQTPIERLSDPLQHYLRCSNLGQPKRMRHVSTSMIAQ